jgi:hypothetical protein
MGGEKIVLSVNELRMWLLPLELQQWDTLSVSPFFSKCLQNGQYSASDAGSTPTPPRPSGRPNCTPDFEQLVVSEGKRMHA